MSSMKNHADGFVNAVSNIYHYFTNNDIIDKAKRALTSNENMIEDKYVHFVNNVTVYQPGMTMRRYMMAEPKVYDMYTNNLCSGYNDEFVNEEQDLKPTLRDDYLHVMDGYVNDKYTMFYDDENPLSIRDRFIVQDAWDTMRELMSYGYDPTSPIYENSKVSDMLTVDTIKEFLYENVDKDIDKIVFNKVSKKILKKYKIKG